jgi:hypothetical protein
LALVFTAVAFGQEPNGAAANGGAVSPPNPLSWIKFILDLGVPGVLAVGIWKLWANLQRKEAEWQADRQAWADEKAAMKEQHEVEKDRIWDEARKDKGVVREAIEREKTEMRGIYTTRLDQLQQKNDVEQKDRREEAERLLREQNVLTREVMETAQAMAHSLQENSRVVEKLTDSMNK